MDRFLSNAKNSLLFHTAGIIHPRKVSENYKVNTIGTENLLKAASKFSIKRAVIMSSNSPCGCNISRENLFNEKSPYNPYMHYGKSKEKMEKIANDLYSKGLLDLSIIRSPWFYGPFQPARQKLFFEMIRTGKVPIVGSGQNIRSMSYTENLVQGMTLAATKNIASGETYWIADEKPYSMNEIVSTIENLLFEKFGQKCSYKRFKLPNAVGDIAEKLDLCLQGMGIYNKKIHVLSEMNKDIACSIEKAVKDLGFRPKFSLKKGMEMSLKELY